MSYGHDEAWRPCLMSAKRSKSEGFMLRFPDGMREQMKEAALASGRSMNAEIVHRLQTSLEADDVVKRNYPHEYKVTISLSKDTVEKIRQEAEINKRDINKEISYTLERSYPDIYPIGDIIYSIQNALEKAMISHSMSDVGKLHEALINASHRMYVDAESKIGSGHQKDLRDFYSQKVQEIAKMVDAHSGEKSGSSTDQD